MKTFFNKLGHIDLLLNIEIFQEFLQLGKTYPANSNQIFQNMVF